MLNNRDIMPIISSIEALVVAVAAVASVVILWKTFKSVNEQTALSRQQYEMMARQQEEYAHPELSITDFKYRPSAVAGTNGLLSVTVRNLGRIAVRKLRMTVQCDNTTVPLLAPGASFTIPPGGSETVSGAFYFQPQADWTQLDTIFDFEARAGARFQQIDRWHFDHRSPNFFWRRLDSKLAPLD
jgi:hypothetical protein